MTLAVARIVGSRIGIVADTLVTEHGIPLPHSSSVIKSCMLPGDTCVSFSNSPELAARDFECFAQTYPTGAPFSEAVAFFETSSVNTGNDYLLAFSRIPRIVKIVEGRRTNSMSKTQWIGDETAFQRFRDAENRISRSENTGRAVNAVMFMDEMAQSPASDLFSAMREVIADRHVTGVGGFACVISNRDPGFRHSVYSDMLLNWPAKALTLS